jgi:Flp pilus assembly protein TadD
MLGLLQLSSGNATGAVASIDRRVALEPDSAAAHLQLANAYAAAGDDQGFERALLEALGLSPDAADAGRLIAYYIDQARDADARARRLERIESLAPERPEALAYKAADAMREQRLPAAEALLREGVERFPDQRRFVLDLARVQIAQRKLDAAATTLNGWLARRPEDTLALTMLGELQLARGDAGAGRATLAQVLDLSPDNARVLNNLAWLLRDDDTPTALRHARRAVALSERREPRYLDTLGLILLESGDAQAARTTLRDAVSLNPSNPTFQYHFALALERTDGQDRALRVLDQLLAEQRAFPERQQAEALAQRLRSGNTASGGPATGAGTVGD